jgi:hypothetical protein
MESLPKPPPNWDSSVADALARPLLVQDPTVHVGMCTKCDRVYAGAEPPKGCREHPEEEIYVRVYTRS